MFEGTVQAASLPKDPDALEDAEEDEDGDVDMEPELNGHH